MPYLSDPRARYFSHCFAFERSRVITIGYFSSTAAHALLAFGRSKSRRYLTKPETSSDRNDRIETERCSSSKYVTFDLPLSILKTFPVPYSESVSRDET